MDKAKALFIKEVEDLSWWFEDSLETNSFEAFKSSSVDDDDDDGTAPANLTIKLQIEGMTCGSCEYKIVKELKKLEGITEATASWMTSRGKFTSHHGK